MPILSNMYFIISSGVLSLSDFFGDFKSICSVNKPSKILFNSISEFCYHVDIL